MPFDIDLTSTPFDTDRVVEIKGSNPTLGFELTDCPKFGFPKLMHCKRSTPSARILKWRSKLRNGFINRINDLNVNSIAEITAAIEQFQSKDDKSITVHYAIINTIAVHTEKGLPQFSLTNSMLLVNTFLIFDMTQFIMRSLHLSSD